LTVPKAFYKDDKQSDLEPLTPTNRRRRPSLRCPVENRPSFYQAGIESQKSRSIRPFEFQTAAAFNGRFLATAAHQKEDIT
jgi:hypothetical protein